MEPIKWYEWIMPWLRKIVALYAQCEAPRQLDEHGSCTFCIRRKWHIGKHRDYLGERF